MGSADNPKVQVLRCGVVTRVWGLPFAGVADLACVFVNRLIVLIVADH